MNKAATARFLTALLVLVVPVANAVNLVKANDNDTATDYVDVDSIRSLTPTDKLFSVVSNFKAAATPTSSYVSVYRINCSSRRIQAQRMTAYSDLYGGGRVVTDSIGGFGNSTAPGHKFEEAPADGMFLSYANQVCGSQVVRPPVQAEVAPPTDVKCDSTEFAKSAQRAGGHPSLSEQLVSVAKRARLQRPVPAWLQNPSQWLEGEGRPGASCVRWNGAEWFIRDIFWPHQAPEGNGFLAVNLTAGSLYVIVGKDVSLTEHQITYTSGADQHVVKVLSDGYLAPFAEQVSPMSCFFAPTRPVCKN